MASLAILKNPAATSSRLNFESFDSLIWFFNCSNSVRLASMSRPSSSFGPKIFGLNYKFEDLVSISCAEHIQMLRHQSSKDQIGVSDRKRPTLSITSWTRVSCGGLGCQINIQMTRREWLASGPTTNMPWR